MRKDFLGTFEAAKLCRVSPGTISRWIKEGKLPASVTAGGHHRISLPDFVKFMRSLRMPVPAGIASSKDLRILIVDDEKEIRRMIRWIIESEFPGTAIEEAEDGFTAGWKARDFSPHLVILDVHMPGLNGFQVIPIVRQISNANPARILVVSGLPEQDIERKARELGADDFLQKPFPGKALQEKISGILKSCQKDQNHEAA